jgi:glycosyltransferase involved in cell wall biosynthesis
MPSTVRVDSGAPAERQLVAISRGSGYDPRAVSGTPVGLFDALSRRYPVAERVDVDLDEWQRWPVRLLSIHPRLHRWRGRYEHSPLSFAIASLNSRRQLRAHPGAAVAVQVYGMFRTYGKPYVMYLDSTDDMAYRFWRPWTPYGPIGRAAWQALERDAYRHAEHVFTASAVTRASVIDAYGVDPARVSVVGAGSNFAPLPVPRPRPRTPEILFVGREWERKGGPELLTAFAKVRTEIPEARLIIAGTTDAPAEPGVEVMGLVGREELSARFAAACMFCMPSRFDPFPNSLMEAMAYGLPCVSTTTAGVPELVVDGETGVLIAPGDATRLAEAMLTLLREPELADAMGRAGRVRVEEELTWDRVVDRMSPVLEAIGVQPLAGDVRAA